MNRFPTSFCLVCCWVWAASSPAQDARVSFLKLIGQPKVPLAPEIERLATTNDLAEFHFSFDSTATQRVPGVLMKRKDAVGQRPAVIALHGTGGSTRNMRSLCRKLAREGFIAVSIDGRYHGERTRSGRGSAEYQEAIVDAWRGSGEHPFYFDTVWDVTRLIDYLETRDDVDPKRIGAIGISKGGTEAYLAAAVDERVAVAVPCIGVQGFRWALEHDAWQARIDSIQTAFDTAAKEADEHEPGAEFVREFYDRLAPGILGEFDGPAMLPLIAPRPLLVINGDNDPRTPMPGVKTCMEAARSAYQAEDAGDRCELIIQKDTGHQVLPESQQAAIDWFKRWLKP